MGPISVCFSIIRVSAGAAYPLGKSGTAGVACFCRDFTSVVAIGVHASRKFGHAGAQRSVKGRGVTADINVTVLALARYPRPYTIFEGDSK